MKNSHTHSDKPLIAVTMGDPGGVGPEIVLKAVRSFSADARFLLIGKAEIFEKARKVSRLKLNWQVLGPNDDLCCINRLSVLDLPIGNRFKPRAVHVANGRLAFLSLRAGAALARHGIVDALVTAPVSKEAINVSLLSNDRSLEGTGFKPAPMKDKPVGSGHARTLRSRAGFVDQTEFLASYSKSKHTAMTFAHGRSVVVLATNHYALKDVPSRLKKSAIVEKTMLAVDFVKRALGVRRPKVAVLGLNPHAGEGGLLGREDDRLIRPAVDALKKRGISVEGPLPADSAFYHWQKGKFDIVTAMYHDQGLAPFKMLYFHKGVHLTLGLPFIRTSPDHGTAFSQAWRDRADPAAMREAIRMAIALVKP